MKKPLFVIFLTSIVAVLLPGAQNTSKAAKSPGNYHAVPGWAKLPGGWSLSDCSGVAVDQQGHILLFNRGEHPIIEFKPDGTFIRSWAEGTVSKAHGLRVDAENNIWITDVGNHTVTKYDHNGKALMTLGEKGKPGDDNSHFNQPADVAFAPNGDVFVADGYGNSRAVKFDKNGRFIKAWGKKGTAPGEFNLVHAVRLDSKGLVYVGDRENNRIQVFDQDGKFIRMWAHLGAPFGLFITKDDRIYIADGRAHKVSIVDRNGKVLHSFGMQGTEPGKFHLPHGITVAPDAAIYVSEITNKRVQKFIP